MDVTTINHSLVSETNVKRDPAQPAAQPSFLEVFLEKSYIYKLNSLIVSVSEIPCHLPASLGWDLLILRSKSELTAAPCSMFSREEAWPGVGRGCCSGNLGSGPTAAPASLCDLAWLTSTHL